MTPVLAVWAIAPALVVVHVVRCVLAERRDRRCAHAAARPGLRLVPRDELADQRARRRERGTAA